MTFKAGSSRFNIALPSYQWKNGEMVVVNGSFAVQNRIHNGIKQSIAYTLQNPVNGRKETVDIPWAVTAGSVAETKALFPSASEFYARNCTKKSETHSMSITSGKEIKTMISPVWTSNGKLSNVYKGRDHSFFLLSDGKTGVWMISHFSPPNETEVMRWASDMTHGLKALEDHGATRLIIDVTNNGGGIICLGCAAAYFIAPWESKTCYRYDIRLTDPLVSLFKRAHEEASRNSSFDASVFNMTMYGRTSEAKAMLSPNELLSPGRTRVRGGVAGRYSNLFTLDHDCIQSLDMVTDATKFPQLKRGWKIKDIGLLSNGICGSTCSNFARTLRDKHHIASFTYAFEGGMVVDYAALTQPFSKEVDGAPTLESLEFPLGRARIPFFEVYPDYDKKGEMPAEWVIADSEYYVDGVSSLDYEGCGMLSQALLLSSRKTKKKTLILLFKSKYFG
ncbi:hypothetical protein BCR33DRAFT_724437 [Rhizoclosmatium globosum]|uniref:Uncharacterized protein n=1 Tax=Rhizoclosmatium globosum TaxID=329046 RepID=A0A1Y2B6N2_9FUNG|nr:hypothetical protein BCR33DRAFT_724437 [Rhizoclosmatium globosum]|eukprot:ORY30127.1 hypothetical protein BCR33DRAFT_724437 [Rhizoclosmatium globosum]